MQYVLYKKNSNEGTLNMQITLAKNHVAQRTPFLNVCNNPLQKEWHCLKDKYISIKKMCIFNMHQFMQYVLYKLMVEQ